MYYRLSFPLVLGKIRPYSYLICLTLKGKASRDGYVDRCSSSNSFLHPLRLFPNVARYLGPPLTATCIPYYSIKTKFHRRKPDLLHCFQTALAQLHTLGNLSNRFVTELHLAVIYYTLARDTISIPCSACDNNYPLSFRKRNWISRLDAFIRVYERKRYIYEPNKQRDNYCKMCSLSLKDRDRFCQDHSWTLFG